MSKIKLGTTLYSFTNEQRDLGWTTEDCMREAASMGLQGVELVASQTFGTSYPWPSQQELNEVRALAEKYGLEICSYSGQADRGKASDRLDLSEDEMFVLGLNDIKNAYAIGAHAQRQQNNIYPNVLKRLAPYAEKYQVKVGIEMHQPMTPCEENSEVFIRVMDEIDSPYIGWCPDFGMFDTALGMLNFKYGKSEKPTRARRLPSRVVMPAAYVDFFEYESWQYTPEEILEKGKEYGLDARQMELMDKFLHNVDIAGEARKTIWEDFERVTIPRCVHFHGKFNELGDDGDDVTIPTSRIVEIIKRSNYEGYISIEYEGHGRFPDVPAAPILRKHVDFYRNTLGIR